VQTGVSEDLERATPSALTPSCQVSSSAINESNSVRALWQRDEERNMMVEEHALVKETEDQKALRALLAGDMDSAPQIDSIPVPPSETDALQ